MRLCLLQFDREDMICVDYSTANCIYMYPKAIKKYLQVLVYDEMYSEEDVDFFVEKGYAQVFVNYNKHKTNGFLTIQISLEIRGVEKCYQYEYAIKRFTDMIEGKQVFEVYSIDII